MNQEAIAITTMADLPSHGYRLSADEERRYIGTGKVPPQQGVVSIPQHTIVTAAPQMVMYPQYAAAVSQPPPAAPVQTFYAVCAETGKPVRVMGLQPAGPVDAAPLPPQAAAASFATPLYHTQPAAQQHPGYTASLEHQRQQQLALQQQHQTALAQRPPIQQHLPLFMLDPHAPIEDLAAGQQMSQSRRSSSSSPPLVQDAYSLSKHPQAVMAGTPITASMQELMAQRAREEEEHRAQLYAVQQQQQQYHHSAYALNLPASQLARHQMSMQQLQHHSSLAQPMYPLHRRRSNSSTPTQLDPNEPRMIVLQNLPAAKPGEFPAVMFCEADEERLTSYQCLLRKQLELFEADDSDVQHSTRQGRTAPIKVGQVGVRCRHCSAPGMASKTKGASYYSQTIEGIYQVCCASIVF